MHYDAGCGRWRPLDEARGPALGLQPGAEYPSSRTVLQRGDALLVYTDGIIESRARDLDDVDGVVHVWSDDAYQALEDGRP